MRARRTLCTQIMAPVEAEMDSVLADFGTNDLNKIMLITTKAAVLAIVKAEQKQLITSVDTNLLYKTILESRHKKDELQPERKDLYRWDCIIFEESEDQLQRCGAEVLRKTIVL